MGNRAGLGPLENRKYLAPWRVILQRVLLMFVIYVTASLDLWDSSSKMGLQEVGSGDMNWIELAQDRVSWRALVNSIMNLLFP
jgi:hypothetical protein